MSSESPVLLVLSVGPVVALVSMVAARRRTGAARRRAQWTFWAFIPLATVLAGAALVIWPEVHQEWERGPSDREIMLGGFALLTAVAWLLFGAIELLLSVGAASPGATSGPIARVNPPRLARMPCLNELYSLVARSSRNSDAQRLQTLAKSPARLSRLPWSYGVALMTALASALRDGSATVGSRSIEGRPVVIPRTMSRSSSLR